MKYNNDFKYDLEVGQVGEKYLGNILQSKKIEVKTDLQAHKTGNIFIEYYSRGKPSGISTSEADFYAFILSNEKIIIIKYVMYGLYQTVYEPSTFASRYHWILEVDRVRIGI